MGKRALSALTSLLLSLPVFTLSTQPASAQITGAEAPNRIAAFTAWDEEYLYLAVQVNKPELKGKNAAPFSNPKEDDAIILTFQTDNDKTATLRTAKTFTVVVSEEGGAQLYTGVAGTPLYKSLADFNEQIQAVLNKEKDPKVRDAKFLALSDSIIAVGVNKKGAKRATGTVSSGYTTEIRIPWADLGGKPAENAHWGFHLAAQSVVPSSPALQSLSKRVLSQADLDNPSLFHELVFAASPLTSEGAIHYAPRVLANKPNVDGELVPGEYSALSLIEFGERLNAGAGGSALPATLAARTRPTPKVKPARKTLPLPVALPKGATTTGIVHAPQTLTPLTLAKYVYRYQGDPRREVPVEGITRTDGGTALAQHPLSGTGPWMTYERADWHRKNLQDARKAGIDAFLTVYRGAESDRKRFADRGLVALVQALQSLRNENKDYPQIALWLDLSGVAEALGERPDLHDEKAKSTIYAQILHYFEQVPSEFRLGVRLSPQNGGRLAYPVFLAETGVLKGVDETALASLRERFVQDFGTDLLFVGETGLEGAGVDGILASPRTESKIGWLKVQRVNPGFDPTYAPGGATEGVAYRPNLNGDTYRKDWDEALAKNPALIVIDSWNEYTLGSAVSPTLEAGVTLVDLTRLSVNRLNKSGKLRGKIVSHNAPAQMMPSSTYRVEARIQNTGYEGWGVSPLSPNPVVLRYRWLKGESIVATGAASPVFTLLSGDTATTSLEVSTTKQDGTPLEIGDYTLEIVGELEGGKASTLDIESKFSVKVPLSDLPEFAATVTRTDLPTQMENGGVYTVQSVVRNDGSKTWKKAEGAYVALRLTKTNAKEESYLKTADASVALDADVLPGQEARVTLTLPVTDGEGNSLKLSEGETNAIRLEVGDNIGGSLGERTPVMLQTFDFGVRFTFDGSQATLPADRKLPIRISLQNTGSQTWKAQSVRVGYHWYYADGSEYVWEDDTFGIPKDVEPGGFVNDLFPSVTAPAYDGTYWLVWDVKVGETWVSTMNGQQVSGELVRPVRVFGGKLHFCDLSKGFNLDGTTEEGDFFDGDFDGQGHTFPAPVVPPYTDLSVLPSGMWLSGVKSGPDSQKRIGFRWGGKDATTKNFVECQGQRLELGKTADKFRFIHILASSSAMATGGGIKVIYQEPSSQTADLLSFSSGLWELGSAASTETVGFLAKRRHSHTGVERKPVALYHYIIKIGAARTPVALVLPNAPEIKIAAVTLEK